MKNLYLFLSTITIFLTGCASDPSTVKEVSLKLSASCNGLSSKSAFTIPSGISTGIYVTAKDTIPNSSCFANREYISDESGSLLSTQNIYLLVGSNYDIYAYAPFQNKIDDPNSISFNHGTDILWASKYTLLNVNALNNSANLSFTHKAAQISFDVAFADDFDSGTKVFTSSSSILVYGFYTQGILNLTSGEIAPSGSTTASLSGTGSCSGQNSSLGINACCFIPPQGIMTLKIKIIHEGLEYNGTITDSFCSENAYHYTITMNNHSPILGIKGVVTDWIPVSDSISLEQ